MGVYLVCVVLNIRGELRRGDFVVWKRGVKNLRRRSLAPIGALLGAGWTTGRQFWSGAWKEKKWTSRLQTPSPYI